VKYWVPEADVGIRSVIPLHWGHKGHNTNKHDSDGASIVDASAVRQSRGRILHIPPPKYVEVVLLVVKGWREGEEVTKGGDTEQVGTITHAGIVVGGKVPPRSG
jgi:hypothetical protein